MKFVLKLHAPVFQRGMQEWQLLLQHSFCAAQAIQGIGKRVWVLYVGVGSCAVFGHIA